MMGPDVERILSGINLVKDVTTNCIKSLSEYMSYQITCDAAHAGTAFGNCTPTENEVPISASNFVEPIKSAINFIESDCDKMDSLYNGLYTSANSFNNGYGLN